MGSFSHNTQMGPDSTAPCQSVISHDVDLKFGMPKYLTSYFLFKKCNEIYVN